MPCCHACIRCCCCCSASVLFWFMNRKTCYLSSQLLSCAFTCMTRLDCTRESKQRMKRKAARIPVSCYLHFVHFMENSDGNANIGECVLCGFCCCCCCSSFFKLLRMKLQSLIFFRYFLLYSILNGLNAYFFMTLDMFALNVHAC